MPFRLYGLTWLARNWASTGEQVNWEAMGLNVFAQNLRNVLQRLRDLDPEIIEFTDENDDTTVINEPPGDPDFPPGEPPDTDPDPDIGGTTVTTRTEYARSAVPCLVGTRIAVDPPSTGATIGPLGVSTYNVQLYPFGVASSIYDPFGGSQDQDPVDGIALQLQIDVDETIPEDTWTIASRIVRTDITVTLTIDSEGQPELTESRVVAGAANYIQVPVWL